MAGWVQRIGRVVRHRLHDEASVRRALPRRALRQLEARVGASERRHSGEIRVCIEAGLPLSYLSRDLNAHDRALTLFGKLRVWDTDRRNGVLVYLLLAERAIEIIADRGLNRHVTPADWREIVERMRQPLREGQFEDGLNAAIDGVDALLVRHFTLADGEVNPNELTNSVDIR